MLCSTRDRALQPGVVLCSARKGQRRGVCALGHQVVLCSTRRDGGNRGVVLCSARREGFVLWSTRFCFAAPVGMGGNRVVVLCSARGGERRGVCALEHQVELCSTRKDGGEERRGALRQGRGEERGLCFAAPEGMDGNKGVVLCSARGGEGTGACAFGIQGALQHEGGWGGTGGLCFAAPGEGRGEGLVLLSTRLCFAAPGKMGGNRGVVLCSARGGERRKVRALEHQIVLCSTRADGGEEWENSKCTRVPYGKTQSAPRQS